MQRRRVLILGAAGRDFHNFNAVFREDPSYEVVGFTATQIPRIDGRRYPPALAGPHYPDGILIHSEDNLEALVRDLGVDEAVFAYSDVSYEHVGHIASRALVAGADLRLLGTRDTMLDSPVPVIAVTAIRTGCGKSQTTRYLVRALREAGRRVVVVRHPMPYGDLARQAVQRFATYEDFDRHECTFEEREEYEVHVDQGTIVYAGIDYAAIIEQAAAEADVVLWDGGNNDWPFYRPDVWVTVTDPHRAGHELRYFPSEVNLRGADILVINKVGTASAEAVEAVAQTAARINPDAVVVRTKSSVSIEGGDIKGKRVLCIEDGPTLTHGGMSFGAGQVAAEHREPARVGALVGRSQPSVDRARRRQPPLAEVLRHRSRQDRRRLRGAG